MEDLIFVFNSDELRHGSEMSFLERTTKSNFKIRSKFWSKFDALMNVTLGRHYVNWIVTKDLTLL